MEGLSPVEVRVLGALIEKESTTPEYYPLSLNALANACNQKSNREPVVSYDEDTVLAAIEALKARRFAAEIIPSSGSRVHKFAQRISERLNLGRRELAVLCALLLRGPQTLGELRDRTERLHSFGDLDEVASVLERLAGWDPPLAVKLARQPGTKEPRYAQLLGGTPDVQPAPAEAPVAAQPHDDRLVPLEAEIAELRKEIEQLKQQFSDFRRQFE